MKRSTKRSLVILLSLIMCINMIPMSVFADKASHEDYHEHYGDIVVTEEVYEDTDSNLGSNDTDFIDEGYLDSKLDAIDSIPKTLSTEEYFVIEETVGNSIFYTEENTNIALASRARYFTTVDDAAIVLREGMKNRENEIVINYEVNAETLGEARPDVKILMEDIYYQAIAHTGKATEGDYLRWHIGSIKGTAGCTYDDGAYIINVVYTLTYHTTAEQEAFVDAKIEELITELCLDKDITDYQKILAIYNYICTYVNYDYDNLEDDTYFLKYFAYAALADHSAVCQGYALLFYRLALEAGIDARFIGGHATNSAGIAEEHAWNIVELDDVYYYLDATWDAGQINYNYFLKARNCFANHIPDEEYSTNSFLTDYPVSSEDYIYAFSDIQGAIDYGMFGTGLTWAVFPDYTLVIMGEGEIPDYWSGDWNDLCIKLCPWEAYCSSITSVRIYDGITRIGSCAFSNCESLTNVYVSDTVVEIGASCFEGCTQLREILLSSSLELIGARAFFGCNNLGHIEIPDSVLEIGESAFHYCENLETANIPSGLKVISKNTFSFCTKLSNVTIPSGVMVIDAGAFDCCAKLTEIIIPDTVTRIGGEVGSDDGGCFQSCYGLTSITIPASVTTIGDSVFYNCQNLKVVSLSEGLVSIGDKAFEDCFALEEITIPASVTNLSGSAFVGCTSIIITVSSENQTYCSVDSVLFDKAMTTLIMYPQSKETNTYIVPDSVSRIEDQAFCKIPVGLSRIVLPTGLKSIGDEAFWGSSFITSISVANSAANESRLPEGLISIGERAFESVTLSSLYIPGSTIDVSEGAFRFSHIEEFNVDSDNTEYSSVEGILYNKDQTILIEWPSGKCGDVEIPDGTLSIDEYAFTYEAVECVKLPNSVRTIEASAFYLSGITNLIMGNGVTTIGEEAFRGCYSLTRITFSENLAMIEARAFKSCFGLSFIELPDSLTYLGEEVFCDCVGLTKIIIPQNVTYIGGGVCTNCYSLEALCLKGNPPNNLYSGGFMFSWTLNVPDVIYYYLESHTAWEAVVAVWTEYNWRTVSAEDSIWRSSVWVDGIEYNADKTVLLSCERTKSGTVVVLDSVLEISTSAFENCMNITQVELPDGLKIIGNRAFMNNYALKDINLPIALQSIGEQAFQDCYSLQNIQIPSNVTFIGYQAFACCYLLSNSIVIPAGVTSIEKFTFMNCDITDVLLPDTLTSIAEGAFMQCQSLTQITIPELVGDLGDAAFYQCTSLDEVDISEGLLSQTDVNSVFYETPWLNRNYGCINGTKHTNVVDKAVAATCTENGLTEGKHCSVCGEIFIAQIETEALGHTEGVDKAVPATFTEGGLTEGKHCSVCKEILVEQMKTEALGHTEVVDKGKEATCTESGLTEGKHCSVCKEILVEQIETEALGHTEVTDKAVPATCTEGGLTEGKHCSVCKEILVEQMKTEALGHTEVTDKAVPATCTEGGLTEGKHCSRCNEILIEQEVVEKKDHTYDNNVDSNCNVCGFERDVEIPSSYIGNINSELISFDMKQNDKGAYYLTGQIVVVEWIDGVSTVPKDTPTMIFKSTDGTEQIDVFVTPTGTNTYYFDRFIEGLSPNKEYVFEIASGTSTNISPNRQMNVLLSTSPQMASAKNLGEIGDQKISYHKATNGELRLYRQREEYIGHINSELIKTELVKGPNGNYVSGQIVVVEWVDGLSTVPDKTPIMHFKSVDGLESLPVFVTPTGTNTYYFDRSLGDMDTNKEYIFTIESGNELNVSPYRSMIVTTAAMKNKTGLLWESDTQYVRYRTDANTAELRIYAVNK